MNDSSGSSSGPAQPPPPPRLLRTLRFGFRLAWDSLGFVCASSMTLFLGLCVSLTAIGTIPIRPVAVALSVLAYLALVPPLYAGICWLAHKVFEHDEPSYADLWRGFARLYPRALALGAIQALVTVVLAANIVFYLSRPSAALHLLAIAFLYALLFWLAMQLYHWPLLIAGEAGVIRRENGGPPSLASVLRNGFLLTVSAPAYTLAIALVLAVIAIPLVVSMVGLALLLPGIAAFLTTQAARDQLVRFGVIEPPPDPDEPIGDERWRVS